MTAPIKQIVSSLVVAVLLTLPGCGPGKVTGVSSGSRSWTVTAEDSIPGIHKGAAVVITFKFGSPNGVTVVVWCDRASGSSFHSSSGRDGAFSEGHFRLPDENRLDFRCVTDNGMIAKVTLAGHTYDTSKGSLFLISTQSKETRVKQLDADITIFPTEAVAIKNYALDNTDISAFFTDAKNDNSAEHEQ